MDAKKKELVGQYANAGREWRPAGDPVKVVDIKDYTSARTLTDPVHAQGGDRGGTDWLVVPDHHGGHVPLLSGMCAKYDMRVATASEFGEMVYEKAG